MTKHRIKVILINILHDIGDEYLDREFNTDVEEELAVHVYHAKRQLILMLARQFGVPFVETRGGSSL